MMGIHKRFRNFEKAQTMPTVVLVFLVLVAFSALVIDGGSIMLNRRTAQAAADAGAMAGARELCYPSGADPLVVANNYAMMNEAETANAYYDNGSVAVDTSVENNSFFAGIFNQDTNTAEAEAVAGCFPPEGNYLMPIAWACRPSLIEEPPFDPDYDCKLMALDWVDLVKPLVKGTGPSPIEIPGNDGYWYEMSGDSIVDTTSDAHPPKQIYIIMDKIAVGEETLCKEDMDPGDPLYDLALVCDLDGDGKNDVEGGGNRGWLDLTNGGGGASDMVNWITNGVDFPISPHTWLSGQTGTVTSVYEAIRDYRQGDVVMIPVFNTICDDLYPTSNTACMDAAHAAGFPPLPPTGDIDDAGQKPKFHVISFDAFYISCVHTFSFDYCPGFALAQERNPDPDLPHKSLIPDNTPSVEGYFLTNVENDLDLTETCNVNLGNCIVSLTK